MSELAFKSTLMARFPHQILITNLPRRIAWSPADVTWKAQDSVSPSQLSIFTVQISEWVEVKGLCCSTICLFAESEMLARQPIGIHFKCWQWQADINKREILSRPPWYPSIPWETCRAALLINTRQGPFPPFGFYFCMN